MTSTTCVYGDQAKNHPSGGNVANLAAITHKRQNMDIKQRSCWKVKEKALQSLRCWTIAGFPESGMTAFHCSRPTLLLPHPSPIFSCLVLFPLAPLPSYLKGKLSLFAEIGMSIPAPLTRVCRSPPFILVKWLVLVVISPPCGGAFILPREHPRTSRQRVHV